ncbi:hypothetical protein JRO89_XS07G0298900 [Xanthoceras sorbifolium]|uniref:Uncharacterized protein n=1 Tax=Xanthoceras sorbifolium TaxID=99658 RepID=A0ABQ8HVU8_9ROSI|nr:hypothetical protein JRO89_XS07G0298900 [Xanthoceras sorbifolium]
MYLSNGGPNCGDPTSLSSKIMMATCHQYCHQYFGRQPVQIGNGRKTGVDISAPFSLCLLLPMELLLSHYSQLLRVSNVNSRWRAFSDQTKTPIKLTHKLSDLSFKCSSRSNGLSSFVVDNNTRFIGVIRGSSGPYRRSNPISASADQLVEAAGSDHHHHPIPSTLAGACWRFLRPYAIYATVLAAASLVARSWLVENPNLLNWSLLLKSFFGLLALVSLNAYYVGINQIYDVDIDKINKPELPLAAGDLSMESAWLLVIFYAVTGLLIVGYSGGPVLLALSCLGLLVGTIYSVPPFRWKRFAVGTMVVIGTMRGLLLHIGLNYATRAALGLPFQWTAPAAFITVFATLFAVVMSLIKDLPDVEGDRKYQIETLATKLGVRNIAFLGTGLMLLNYVVGVLAAIYMPQIFRRNVMIPAHIILASYLIFQTWALEQAKYSKEAASKFYRFIWDLLYLEYLIYPFI